MQLDKSAGGEFPPSLLELIRIAVVLWEEFNSVKVSIFVRYLRVWVENSRWNYNCFCLHRVKLLALVSFLGGQKVCNVKSCHMLITILKSLMVECFHFG